MRHDLLLMLHVTAGAAGLALGPLALLLPGGSRGRSLALAYQWAVLAVALTALGLVALDPAALWWLVPLALFASACVVVGLRAPRRRVRLRLHGLGGSYIALVTAALVVSVEGPASAAAWALPTVVGFVLIERAVAHARRLGLAAMREHEDNSTPVEPR